MFFGIKKCLGKLLSIFFIVILCSAITLPNFFKRILIYHILLNSFSIPFFFVYPVVFLLVLCLFFHIITSNLFLPFERVW